MPLIKDGALATAPFIDVSADEQLADSGALLVSLEHWLAPKYELPSRPDPLGIILRSDAKAARLAAPSDKLVLIPHDFLSFLD